MNFIKFDVVEFYPSITEKLYKKALNLASRNTEISKEDKQLMLDCKSSFVWSDGKLWTKSNGILFDVPMGSYDGAEVCEMVGLYLLCTEVKKILGNAGLYREG